MFLILSMFPLYSQEAAPGGGGSEEPASSEGASSPKGDAASPDGFQDDSTLYVITGYKYNVKGRSSPIALQYKLIEHGEYREGETITGKTNLEKYISDITQIYINQRVLKNNVEVSYSAGGRNEAGAYPVTIIINVEDSFNIIAIPRPYFKNDEFDITIKARDYNFLGTMNPLRIDLGYNYNENKEQSYLFGVFTDIPFKAFGYYWTVTFDNTLQYRVDAPFYYQNTTGLSVELPFRSTTFYLGFSEKIFLNEENSDWTEGADYGPCQDGLYMSSNMSLSWRIPTGLTVPGFGELAYTPGITATINHELPKWPLDYFRKGPFINFIHSLGFGKIDWHENYREGLSVSLSNVYSYDFYRTLNSISLNFTGIGHYIVSEFFAISSRFMYQYWYSSEETSEVGYTGAYMRGIADKSNIAYQMFLLNLDLPFRLFVFTPSKWFNNRKLSLFDFEMHASPVIDLALYYPKSFQKGRTIYYPGQIAATGGLEVVVFPLFMRNLYMRFGFAVNIKEFLTTRPFSVPDGDNREIYLIMEHFF